MNYKPFPDSYWVHIKQIIMQLKEQLKPDPTPLYVAFDADGTLWDMDLGENFFNYQIDQQCVDLPNNPWNYYQELKKQNNDPCSAYLWLAQINKNQPIEQVRKWSQLAYEQAQPVPLFSEQKKLIQLFMENDIQVFIVMSVDPPGG